MSDLEEIKDIVKSHVHAIKTPLSILSFAVEDLEELIAKSDLKDNPEAKEYFQQIKTAFKKFNENLIELSKVYKA